MCEAEEDEKKKSVEKGKGKKGVEKGKVKKGVEKGKGKKGVEKGKGKKGVEKGKGKKGVEKGKGKKGVEKGKGKKGVEKGKGKKGVEKGKGKKGVEKGKGKKGVEKGKGKKGVEKGKGKKVDENGKGKKGDDKGIGKKRAEKQGMMIKKTKMILVGIGNAWCVIPCSFFQQEEDDVECKWVQCQSVTKHRMSLASQKFTDYISLLKVKMKRNTFVQTVQILPKTVTITCDSVEFHSPEVQVARRIGCLIRLFQFLHACKYIACLSAD